MLSPMPSVSIGPISFTFGPVIEFGAGCKADVKAVVTATFGAQASADLSLGVAYDQVCAFRTTTPVVACREDVLGHVRVIWFAFR